MSLARAVFAFALLTPVLGATGSKFFVSAVFGQSPKTVVAPGAAQIAVLPTQMIVPVATAAPPTPTPSATATPLVSATPDGSPAASPTSGAVTLVRSRLGETTAHAGDTLSVGYVIQNGTETGLQLAMGVSMKSSSAPSWLSSFADPSHDAVADVPPGISTHERFFTLPADLAPGSYDVAWGLRDQSGHQVTLTSSSAALRVVK